MKRTNQKAEPARRRKLALKLPTSEQVAEGNKMSGRKRSVRPGDAKGYHVMANGVLRRKTPACTNCREEKVRARQDLSPSFTCTSTDVFEASVRSGRRFWEALHALRSQEVGMRSTRAERKAAQDKVSLIDEMIPYSGG